MKEMCNGKAQYLKKTAETVRNKRLREGEDFLRIYQCPQCNFWHLTKHKTYYKQSAMKKLLYKRKNYNKLLDEEL